MGGRRVLPRGSGGPGIVTGRMLPAAVALVLWIAAMPAVAGQQPAGLTVYAGQGVEPARIAIPTFAAAGGAAVRENNFRDIIYRDLELTGYFSRPGNQTFVEENAQLDRKAGAINFPEWQRLGAVYLVEGSYELQPNGQLAVTAILHYVPSGKRIFGKRFVNAADQQRVLAHHVSDEIFYWVTGQEGVANTKLLYSAVAGERTRGNREIWVMDADGYGARPVTNEGRLNLTPGWGANATEIYYTTYRDYNPDLSGIYLRGGAPWFISRYPGLNASPSWSQARQRIALTLGKDGNSEIYTISREGKAPKRLTYEKAIDSSPAWSPSGNDIAFTSDRAGSPQIYIMDGEGMNVRRVSFVNSNWCDGAVWSPQGNKLTFAARVSGQFQIFVCEVDGSNPVQLTSSGNNEDPSWSPNGLLVAFASDRNGSPQIYIMNNDGSNQRGLTNRGYNTSPAWSQYLFEKKR